MSALGESLKGLAKFLWVLMMFGLLAVEYRAIDNDKRESQKQLVESFAKLSEQADTNFKETLRQSNDNLKQMLQDEHTSFATVLQEQQKGFLTTLNGIVANDQNENQRFTELLSQQQKLFSEQLETSAFVSGRLLPGNDPTPDNPCSNMLESGDVVVLIGTNGYVTKQFPHAIIIAGKRNVLGIDRKADGSLAMQVDMRDEAGKVLIRLDADGLRASSSVFMTRPDKSSVLFEDATGNDILYAKYVNRTTFAVRGYLIVGDQKINIGDELNRSLIIKHTCLSHNLVDIHLNDAVGINDSVAPR